MSEAAQAIFKKICLRNRLLDKDTLDALLGETPDPEQLVKNLSDDGILPPSILERLLPLYRKLLAESGFDVDFEVDDEEDHEVDLASEIADAVDGSGFFAAVSPADSELLTSKPAEPVPDKKADLTVESQQIFKKICLRNRIFDEATIDRFLDQIADPEKLIKKLVEKEILPAKVADRLIPLYQKLVGPAPDQNEKNGGPVVESLPIEESDTEDDEVDLATELASASEGSGFFVDTLREAAEEAPEVDESSPQARLAAAHRRRQEEKEAAEKGADGKDAADTEQAAAKTDSTKADAEKRAVAEKDKKGLGSSQAKLAAAQQRRKAEKEALKKRKAQASAAFKKSDEPEAEIPVHPDIAQIFDAAIKLGASDVHITSGRPAVVRIANELKELDMPALPPDKCREVLLSMLTDVRREQFEQTLDLDFCYDGGAKYGRFRTNYFVEQGGMSGVFRLITEKVPTMEDLNLPDQIKKLTDATVGVILVTGPKSAGKTTTLAAMLDLLNSTRQEHILTIEDPIEYIHPTKKAYLTQREVGTHTESFSAALKGAMREAPDIIMVGEMRDLETTSLVITAAETGFLVLATLHTPDAIRTIGRVLGVFPAKEQAQIRSMLAKSLRGIVSQQLIPSADGKSLELAIEVLVNTPAISNLIRENRTFQLPSLMQVGGRLGMVLMDDSLVKLVKEDRITKEEAAARASDEAKVRRDLGMPVHDNMD